MVDLRAEASRPSTSPAAGRLASQLREWIADSTGSEIVRAQLLPGGNRRQAWAIDVRDPQGDLAELFLRYDAEPAPSEDDPYTLWREAGICDALSTNGMIVPAVIAVHPSLQAALMARMPGTASLRTVVDPDARLEVAQDFITHLARLHLLSPEVFAHVRGLTPRRSIAECIVAELDVWEGMYRRCGIADPIPEFGFRWLRRHAPDVPAPPALVHGDTGPGNFLFADGRVTAIIDWELAHFGDPMEDLAWLSVRAAQEGFPDYAERILEYERLVGRKISEERIRYFRVFAELRIVVIRLRASRSVRPNGEVGNSLLSAGLHRRLCVEAVADAMGTAVDTETADLRQSVDGTERVSREVLRELREIVERSSDSLVIAQAKGVARAVKYLSRHRRFGQAAEARDRQDLAELLGEEVPDAQHGRDVLVARIHADELGDADVVRYLGRLVARETHLLADSMGALAHRHLPSIR